MGRLVHMTVLAIFLFASDAKRQSLPNYITPCARTDPNLDECVKKNGQEALKTIVKGDRKYKIPVMDPLFISEMTNLQSDGPVAVKMQLKNLTIVGFKDTQIKSARMDLKGLTLTLEMFTPLMTGYGLADIQGKILVLPIKRNANFNQTLENVNVLYFVKFNTTKRGDGLDYIFPAENKMTFTTTHAIFKIEKLFGQDKVISDNLNVVLNENWELMVQELGEPISQGLGDVLTVILKDILKDVAFQDIFPEHV